MRPPASPPPAPPPPRKTGDGSREDRSRLVLAGWEVAWPRVLGGEGLLGGIAPRQAADRRRSREIADRYPDLDGDGFTALAETYLREWAVRRSFPTDYPTVTTWSFWRPRPSLVLAPPLPDEDSDPLDSGVLPAEPPVPELAVRPQWVGDLESSWWCVPPGTVRPEPPAALVAWWRIHDPESVQLAEQTLGRRLATPAASPHPDPHPNPDDDEALHAAW